MIPRPLDLRRRNHDFRSLVETNIVIATVGRKGRDPTMPEPIRSIIPD